eukprot:SAG31_NODE_1297_length_8934_cov_26.567176_9_plen_64_part_00
MQTFLSRFSWRCRIQSVASSVHGLHAHRILCCPSDTSATNLRLAVSAQRKRRFFEFYLATRMD